LPPTEPFNGYSDQAGFSADGHKYNPFTSTLKPYSGDAEPNANIYHDAKKPGDEPGHWVRKDYIIVGSLNLHLQFDAHLSATVVNSSGNGNAYGGLIQLVNRNKAPIYFGLTTSVLNDKIMPGATRTINLGLSKPSSGKVPETIVTLNVKYWVSEGSAPTQAHEGVRCPNWAAFMQAIPTMAPQDAQAAKKYLKYTDATLFSESLEEGTATNTGMVGPMRLDLTTTETQEDYRVYTNTAAVWTNTGATAVALHCSYLNEVVVFTPGQSIRSTGFPTRGGVPYPINCNVAIAPPDSVTIPFSLSGTRHPSAKNRKVLDEFNDWNSNTPPKQ
jgi:hypothetical protein